ncbi:tripartite tricarboxylate transporter substrate binding protein [Ottowia thiooxydans]|uniref:Tripartite-type tricarboxylate transporter receptor subunit TctC n=1 Tax=Ottowia thiooxydans TaxID=219182 RepID=A0ABV2Q7M5_9BURK
MKLNKLFICASLLVAACGAYAQGEYPQRSITLTVPYGAGGSTDGITRKFANLLESELKQSVIILNQPGAAGTLQLGNLSRAKPDGYTIGMYSYSTATFTSQLMKVPYKREDFDLIGGVAEFVYGIVASPDSPINNVKDLVAQSKTPKGVFFAVTGAPNNFPFLQLQKLTGGKFDQVTYKSSAESIHAVVGKQVDVALQGPSEYAALVKAGKLKFISSASDARLPWFPNAPTIKEQGFDISITGKIGVATPKGVPADIRAKLEKAVHKVASSDEYKNYLANEYGIKAYPATSAEFGKLIDAGFPIMSDMIKTYDIKM